MGVVILIWRNANESEKAFIDNDVVPLFGADTHGGGRRLLLARVVVGVLIGAGGIVLLVEGHTTVAALRPDRRRRAGHRGQRHHLRSVVAQSRP